MNPSIAITLLAVAVGAVWIGSVIFAYHSGKFNGLYQGRNEGREDARGWEREKAIKAGVGKWVIADSDTGRTEFVYGTGEKVQS